MTSDESYREGNQQHPEHSQQPQHPQHSQQQIAQEANHSHFVVSNPGRSSGDVSRWSKMCTRVSCQRVNKDQLKKPAPFRF